MSAPRQGLVVGASSSIGAAVVRAVAPYVDELCGWGRDRSRLEGGLAGVPRASVDLVDVTDPVRVTEALARVVARGPLAVVAWTPGLFDWAAADEADPRTWSDVVAVNLTAPTTFTALAAPHLVAAAPSALIYLGSGAAHQAYADNAAYVASKHGLAGLARATSLDLRRHRIKVSLISPGLVAAGAGLASPAGRRDPTTLLQPDDVAAAVRFVLDFPEHGCPTEIRLEPHGS